MQLVFFASLGGCGHTLGDGCRWYGVPPALPDSQLTAPHQPPRGEGEKVVGRRGLPLNPGGPSLGLEAAVGGLS